MAQNANKSRITQEVKQTNEVIRKATAAEPVKEKNGNIPLDQAKPQPLSDKGDEAPKEKKTKAGDEAVITSKGSAFFDTKQSVGVFTDDVVVVHPQFHLTCEELQVFMLKDSEKPVKGDANNSADGAIMRRKTPLPGEEPEPEPDSSIREAIAKGPKVVIQKLTETGDVQVGICRHATYVGATGDIIMRDYPQLQRGNNLMIATDPSTYFVIKQNGKVTSEGPSTSKIVQGDDSKKPATIAPHAAPSGNEHLPQPRFSSPKPKNN